MADLSIRFQNVSFTYDRAAQPLIVNLSVHYSRGWTGIVGANGVGKSTLLKLATGVLTPNQGQIVTPEFAIYCEQRTDEAPDHLHDLIHAADRDAFVIKDRMAIEDDWMARWETLSHGERKRAQIAVALWRKPQVLAVDEPTNHLDGEARDLLLAALSTFRGAGILVSHDRELLDTLCHQCLFLDPPHAVLRPGNYSEGLKQAAQDETSVRTRRVQAKREVSRLTREATKRRDAASQANRKRSKRGLASKDHDAREKKNLARITGKDGFAGKRLNQLGGRISQARIKLEGIKVKKSQTLGIWVAGEKSKRNALLDLPAGKLPLGENRWLHFPDLSMKPDARIALTGVNGSGKSTFIKHVIQLLNLPQSRVTYLPQEIDIPGSKAVMAQATDLPAEQLGRLMTVVSCLGSMPQRLLESTEPSPGEIRKLLLASGIVGAPHLIIMDEPTNHLDLPSIECLEQALAGCPCGLLLVSHDQRFLDALAHERWHISEDTRFHGKYLLAPV